MANVGIFEPKWSKEILKETHNALVRKDSKIAESFLVTSAQMNLEFPNSLVDGFEHLIGSFSDVDLKDQHVMACAVKSSAGVLVTFNLKDFPGHSYETHGLEIKHPDEFFIDQFDLNIDLSKIAIGGLLASYKKTPMDAIEFSEIMRNTRCPGFASFISQYSGEIDKISNEFRVLGM